MIYCVEFSAVRSELERRGFVEIGGDEDFIAFERQDGAILTVHPPNDRGHLPESLANDAFDAAGLDPPNWVVFWCD